MQKTIGTEDLTRTFETVLDEVEEQRTPYVVTRDSRPRAALVPYADFLRFQEFQDQDIVRLFDRCRSRLRERNENFSDEEVAQDVSRALQEARRAHG